MRINNVISSLTATYHDWDYILVNRSFVRKGNTITWENYAPIRHPDIVYKGDVAELVNTKQYSFQVIDGSVFQLFYDYQPDGVNLNSATLAFFNISDSDKIFEESLVLPLNQDSSDKYSFDFSRELISEQFDKSIDTDSSVTKIIPSNIEMYVEDIPNLEDPLIPWLRVDYSPKEQKGPLHHSCHMHIGLFNEARIPLSCVPTPRQFVEFVISLCYPDEYRKMRLDPRIKYEPLNLDRLKEFNTDCFPHTDGNVFDILPHISIPSR